MRVLVWKNKHANQYYDASTPEALDASAREILRSLIHDYQYVYGPSEPSYFGIDLEQAALTDDQIAELPTNAMRETAASHKSAKERADKEYEDDVEEYQNALKVSRGEEVIVDHGVYRRDDPRGRWKAGDRALKKLTAWDILQDRNGAEYEVFELEEVWTHDV